MSGSKYFDKRMRQLKKGFQRDIHPSIKRHSYYLSKSQREREKHRKALRRIRKRLRKNRKLPKTKLTQGWVLFHRNGGRLGE